MPRKVPTGWRHDSQAGEGRGPATGNISYSCAFINFGIKNVKPVETSRMLPTLDCRNHGALLSSWRWLCAGRAF